MATIDPQGLDELSQEMSCADFTDRRLSARAGRLMAAYAKQPAGSFPDVFRGPGELEAAYRFFDNPRVSPEALLHPHIEGTCRRAGEQKLVRVIHDSSSVEFSGDVPRRGLGPLRGKGQGFFAHVSLVVGEGEERAPLGIAALSTWVRTPKPKGTKPARRPRGETKNGSESARWLEQAQETEARLPTTVVHVMDREADLYELMAGLSTSRYVVRAQHDRVVELPAEARAGTLRGALAAAGVLLHREVHVSSRKRSNSPVQRQIHPPRNARTAKLAVSARAVRIRRPDRASMALPPWLDIHVVRVIEVDAPAGTAPIEWLLLTNLSIDDHADVGAIVDHYRARWLIEEYFKALKTGCSVEQRQLEDVHNLLNALALAMPVAWRLLLVRHAARNQPAAPAAIALTPTQLGVLVAMAELPRRATIRQAMLAIAKLGGHIAHNGEPGWLTLGRGLSKLLLLEQAWDAAVSRRESRK